MKKVIIICVIALVGIGIVFFVRNNNAVSSDSEALVYTGDQGASIAVDIAIQKGEVVLYMGKVKMLDSNPNLLQMIQTINESDEGIHILLNEKNEIVGVDENNLACQVLIDNKEVDILDTSKITLEKYDGVTLYFPEE